jgi:transcriptional regulator with XRE-family HTH domain
MEARGWTYQDLGDKVRMRNVSNYINGKTNPGLKVVDKFADAFGVTTAQLLTDPDAPKASPLVIVIHPTIMESLRNIRELIAVLGEGNLSHPIVQQLLSEAQMKKPKK